MICKGIIHKELISNTELVHRIFEELKVLKFWSSYDD